MANAARVHAIERGKDIAACTMVAFGGGAPLHACRLADKLASTDRGAEGRRRRLGHWLSEGADRL